MKPISRLLIILTLSQCTPAPAITPAEVEKLLPALEQVESGGKADALGDYVKGVPQAVGILQIWPEYVQDVNRISGKAYRLSDRLSPSKSREMARIYLLHYGKNKTIEQTARIHNGGPNGHKKAETLKYWAKVKKELSK